MEVEILNMSVFVFLLQQHMLILHSQNQSSVLANNLSQISTDLIKIKYFSTQVEQVYVW